MIDVVNLFTVTTLSEDFARCYRNFLAKDSDMICDPESNSTLATNLAKSIFDLDNSRSLNNLISTEHVTRAGLRR